MTVSVALLIMPAIHRGGVVVVMSVAVVSGPGHESRGVRLRAVTLRWFGMTGGMVFVFVPMRPMIPVWLRRRMMLVPMLTVMAAPFGCGVAAVFLMFMVRLR